MKKVLFVAVICLVSSFALADEGLYPWILTGYGGGANSCTSGGGCFEIIGPAAGGSFGRAMSKTWSFELDGFWTRGSRILPLTLDTISGVYYRPEERRTRVYGGAMFLAKIAEFSPSLSMFIVVGAVGGYERLDLKTPPGVWHEPATDNGIKGGMAAGAGFNWWFSDSWGLRPEFRFYPVFDNLTGFRYTVGLMRKF
jgi:hypothetical protein